MANIETKYVNFDVMYGDTWKMGFRFYDTDGSYKDVSGWTEFYFYLNDSYLDDNPVIEQSSADMDISNASDGLIIVDLDSTETKLPLEKYYHQFKAVDDAGEVSTCYKGQFIIDRESIK